MPITPDTLTLATLAIWVLTLITSLIRNERFRENFVAWAWFKDRFGVNFVSAHPIFTLFTFVTFAAAFWVFEG